MMQKLLKTFGAMAVFLCGVENSIADTVMIKGQVNQESSQKIFETFVQNAGMLTETKAPTHYYVVWRAIHNVAPHDVQALKQHLQEWVNANVDVTKLKYDLGLAHHFGANIVILDDYPPNKQFYLNKKLEAHLACFSGTEGTKYTFTMEKKNVFLPHINVGPQGEKTPCEITAVLNHRLRQDHLIACCDLYNHQIDAVIIDSTSDSIL